MRLPLRVGVQLPEIERIVPWQEYASIAQAAEDCGFDSVWVGDHLYYPSRYGREERGPWEAWSLLSAIAAVTGRVRLGPLVACAAFHAPAVLAKKAATVDQISGGRLDLGLGAGWNEAEFRAFGIPFEHRATRFVEAFEIIRRLLEGDRVTFEGRFHRVQDAVLLPRPDRRPPLMIGSTGERVLRAGLQHADVWNTWFDWYGNTPEGFAEKNPRISALAEEVGREPDEIERSACVLVEADPGSRERPRADGIHPVERSRLRSHLEELAAAGAEEAILVLDPITERSVRTVGESLSL
ncbi:MAG TPA: LLM class flavin-dependent oxidoreductase [Actinomycetota bacterium]|nr:LLM class flavin-dependent oxidoreductase [Actinomycetota bacterium]